MATSDSNMHMVHWLVVDWTPLKNMSSSIGMRTETQYFWENAKNGNQTTNQTWFRKKPKPVCFPYFASLKTPFDWILNILSWGLIAAFWKCMSCGNPWWQNRSLMRCWCPEMVGTVCTSWSGLPWCVDAYNQVCWMKPNYVWVITKIIGPVQSFGFPVSFTMTFWFQPSNCPPKRTHRRFIDGDSKVQPNRIWCTN